MMQNPDAQIEFEICVATHSAINFYIVEDTQNGIATKGVVVHIQYR